MSKTKAAPQTNGHKIKGDKVKGGRVGKPIKDVVKAKTADKVNGKVGDSKKSSKKAPAPVESSDSESESDAASEGSSASSASDDSESEAETVSKPAAAAKAVVNGAKAVVNGAASKLNGAKPSAAEPDDSASSEGSDAEGSDSEGSDESDEEVPVTKAAEATKATKAAKPAAAKDEAESDESGSGSESDSESETPAKSGTTPAVAKDDASDSDAESDNDDDDDDASSASSSDEEDAPKKAAPAPAQKRKADAIEDTPAKKAKTDGNVNGGTNLFVGSLSWNIDEDWLRREFEHFGTVKGCRVITDRESGRSKGFGYVDFEDPADAQKAHDEMKDYELDGRKINVDFSQPREKTDASPGGFKARANDRGNKYGDQLSPPSDTLFVANLSFDTTADALRERLEQYGDITRISLPTHQDSGQLKGFGYIGFGSVAEAQAALDANKGQMIDGRPVRFDFASARTDNGGDRGGRGGRGGGGFRGRGGGGDRGGRGGGFRGGFGDRGGRGGRGDRGGFRGRGGSTNRGGVGDFSGKKVSF